MSALAEALLAPDHLSAACIGPDEDRFLAALERVTPNLAHAAGRYMHALQWSVLPFLFYIVIRALISALERPLAGLWVGLVAIAINALAGWTLIFGHFGFPRFGLVGAGLATVISSTALLIWIRSSFAPRGTCTDHV